MRFHKEKRHVTLTVGESVRIARELQGITQAELAVLVGMSQPTLSGIERDRVTLGVNRARRLARALRVHPAVLLFPDWVDEGGATPKRRRTAA